MQFPEYAPPPLLHNGLAMTLYAAYKASQTWQTTLQEAEPQYQEVVFDDGEVPLFGKVAIHPNSKGTIVATYGITGTLENQWFLKVLSVLAYDQGYSIVLFDWRAHGESAKLSSVLTSDGINEGKDFVSIAAESKAMGCHAPFWFTGYSLGGQLALWGVYYSQDSELKEDIAGGAVICPNLDANLSLPYLMSHPLGQYIEKAIAKELKNLALQLYRYHPQDFDLDAIERAKTIWGFDRELVVPRLGFASVEEYYRASSGWEILPQITKPTLILYAQDDPMFSPQIIPQLTTVCQQNQAIDLVLTQAGGHVGYISSKSSQEEAKDNNPWWAWNRILEWTAIQSISSSHY